MDHRTSVATTTIIATSVFYDVTFRMCELSVVKGCLILRKFAQQSYF
jgi:hypothetical protein